MPNTGETCTIAGEYISACGHAPNVTMSLEETFPPCPDCGDTGYGLADVTKQ
jgi:hypothetical protein